MDATDKKFRRLHSDTISRCLARVEIALVRQAGDEAASAIISALAEIAHRESGQADSESLYELGLDARTVNGLEAVGIYCVSDLCRKTASEILGVGNFGASTLANIHRELSARGLSLRIEPPPTGRTAPLDTISGDEELESYRDRGKKATLTNDSPLGEIEGASKDELQESKESKEIKEPCEWNSNNHIGRFRKPKPTARQRASGADKREAKLIRQRKANAKLLAAKLEAEKRRGFVKMARKPRPR